MPCGNNSIRKVAIESLGDSGMSTEGLALLCAVCKAAGASLAFKSADSRSLMKLRQISEAKVKSRWQSLGLEAAARMNFHLPPKYGETGTGKFQVLPLLPRAPSPPTSFLFAAASPGGWSMANLPTVCLLEDSILLEHLGAG